MPVPETTGKLRDKIRDMEIGDFIYGYYEGNGREWVLGEKVGSEIPVNGVSYAAIRNGFYYFIKVAKGILVADRVVSHTISWDKLNSMGLIEGRRLSEGNVAIKCPVTASSTYSDSAGSAPSSVITNGNTNKGGYKDQGYWFPHNGDKTPWIRVNLGSPRPLRLIRVYSGDSTNSFAVSISLDNVSYEKFASISVPGMGWYDIDLEGKLAQYIQLHEFPYDNSYGYNVANISEIEAYEVYPERILRSLTGGVAYADESSNMSLTDKGYVGYGAFPTNNEWDKYIVNFPTDKVRKEKILDDVFHYTNTYTWCQETPVNSQVNPDGTTTTGINTSRISRGRQSYNVNSMSACPSKTTDALWGFRPVIEFKE